MARNAKVEGPDPIDRYVGTRVRARRTGLRISQTKLGDALGITFQQVQKYENGGNRIGASNLYKIAQVLDVDVGFFFEGIPEDIADTPHHGKGMAETVAIFDHDPLSSKESIELAHNYFRIRDPEVRARLFQFVRTLATSEAEPADE